ncbi:MAG TPA: CHRD domain-containing protein [Verrucomicrobiae bacterium]|nr:CHRD domain-containing protein [Verrucomicrobiae bacterium]
MKSLIPAFAIAFLSFVLPAESAFYTNRIENFAFNPSSMTVRVGDTIVWINADTIGHTVTGDTEETICGSQLLSQGGMCMRTFDTAGTFPYHCEPHFTFMFGSVTVQPGGNQNPTVSISAPANGQSFTGPTNLTLSANANDPDGTIASVEFFDGSNSLGSDASFPYSVNADFALGPHTLTAVATDNTGAQTPSAPVNITITSPRIANPIPERLPKGDLTIDLQIAAEGMQSPLGFAVPDDSSGRIFVYDQAGLIWVMTNGVKVPTPALDVRNRLTLLGPYDERGLLGAAAHPNFAANPFIYTYTSESNGPVADFLSGATNKDHQSVIAEWRVSASNPFLIDPASRREVLRLDKPQSNHNGGTMRFGPDGYLYFTVGDGGNADDQGDGHLPDGNAQSLDKVLGKVLRIDVNARSSANGQYGIPADNPFVGQAGIDEIYAYGLRNPFSFSFDRATGTLYLGDVGQNSVEEIDIIVKGGNYGWRAKEGTFYFDPNGAGAGYVTTVPVGPQPANPIDPIAQYDHDEGLAIVGGYVYHGTAIPALSGKYVTGDWGSFAAPSGRLFYLDSGNVIKEFRIGREDRPLGEWIRGFGEAPDGELYVCVGRTLGPVGTSGRVLKIVPLPAEVQITRAQPGGGNINADWTGGTARYVLQKKDALTDVAWNDLLVTTSGTGASPLEAQSGFFRIADIANNGGIPLSVAMSGLFERPTLTNTASGFGTMRIEGNQLYIDLRYTGLSGTASAGHIHGPANASVNAPVLIDLSPYNGGAWGSNGTISGAIPLTPAQKAMILDGKTYVNLHTADKPGGEVRGQIAPVLLQANVTGLNERPSHATPAIAQSTMFLVGTQLTFNITYEDLTAPATIAHIHGPANTANSAGILVDLMPYHNGAAGQSGSFNGTILLAPNVHTSLVDRLTYVNIHSSTYPGGEVRGQIFAKPSATPLTAALNGASERPSPVTTPGTGFGSFRLDGSNLIFEVVYTNLTSQATAAHIHGAAGTTAAAGILIDLAPYVVGSFGTRGALAGSINLTPAQKALILNGQTYVNIHTANNPGGEIRGQIAPVLMWAMMNGNNERNASVPTTGTGQSTLFLVGNRLWFDVTYRNLVAPATLSHIHAPASQFANAGVRVDLAPFNGGAFGISGSLVGVATLQSSGTTSVNDLGNVIDLQSYLNVHSSYSPGGEIRGQVLR